MIHQISFLELHKGTSFAVQLLNFDAVLLKSSGEMAEAIVFKGHMLICSNHCKRGHKWGRVHAKNMANAYWLGHLLSFFNFIQVSE